MRAKVLNPTTPVFQARATELVKHLKKLSKAKLKAMYSVSDNIAALNHDRFQQFESNPEAEEQDEDEQYQQAIYAFNGPAYQGLDANSMKKDELHFAQSHLRMLSGLYGVLKPADYMQPYRLEMGTKMNQVSGVKADSLYEFWGDSISQQINNDFANMEDATPPVLVNVASNEYYKSVDESALNTDVSVLNCVFKDDGRIKSVYAKRARGLMCRYVIENKCNKAGDLKKFNLEGYKFDAKDSDDTTYVYQRSKAAAQKAADSRKDSTKKSPAKRRRTK